MEYYLEITGYALQSIALAMVPLSVALHSSAYRCIDMGESFEIGIFFSFFQGSLLFLGWLTGYALSGYFNALAYPIATMIFLFIGLKLFSESRKPIPQKRTYPSRDIRTLAVFSLAISINAFLVGVGAGLIKTNWVLLVAILVLVSYVATLLGIRMGKKGRYRAARNAEISGGLIMLLMAIFMIAQFIKLG